MSVSFRPRRGTQNDWEFKNPRLGAGEMGFETDTQRYKMGDGVRRWIDLPYFINEDETFAYIDEVATEIVEPVVVAKVDEVLTGLDVATGEDLSNHVAAELPHPVYDDGPSFVLLYENAKV